MISRMTGLVSSAGFLLFVLAPLGGLSAYLTFIIAFDLGGPNLFGLYFLGIWATIIAGFLVTVEKTGYSKNFATWNLSFKRILALPLGFAVVAGLILLIIFLAGGLR